MKDEELQRLLQRAMPPIHDAELRRDLWPSMLRKFEDTRRTATWFDWALIAFVALAVTLFPGILPVLLYFL
jgi:hypothetical protein